MGRLTGSKSGLAILCSAWLSEGARFYDPEIGDTSKRDSGSRVHNAIYTGIHSSLESEDEKKMFMHGSMALAAIAATYGSVFQECCYSINVLTREGKYWPEVHNRNYPKAPEEVIFSTADIVAKKDGELLVADFKTGEGEGVKEQLMTVALSVVTCEGFERPNKILLTAIYLTPEKFFTTTWEVTIAELFEHKDKLLHAIQDKRYSPGAHCAQLYCPHAAYCPAHAKARIALSGQEDFVWDEIPSSPEHAGKMGTALKIIDRQSKYFKEALRKYHNEGGRIVDGDYELKNTDRGFRWVSTKT